MRSTKSSLSLFGTLKSKYMFFILSFFHCFIREVRCPSGTGLGKNWAPKMLWARILFREHLANIFSVNCTSISRKYCCFHQQILLFSQMKTYHICLTDVLNLVYITLPYSAIRSKKYIWSTAWIETCLKTRKITTEVFAVNYSALPKKVQISI